VVVILSAMAVVVMVVVLDPHLVQSRAQAAVVALF
jgi:hypothetical protein